jgi:ElaB/YqjD/DUF883 family membrane-anchored ribosome-binding protein
MIVNDRNRPDEQFEQLGARLGSRIDEAAERLGSRIDDATERLGAAGEKLEDRVDEVRAQVRAAVPRLQKRWRKVREALSRMEDEVTHPTTDVAGAANDLVGEARHSAGKIWQHLTGRRP